MGESLTSAAGEKACKRNEPGDLRILYMGYYMALGAVMPYITLYYERSGLSGLQIGMLFALMQLTTSMTAIPWGAAADRFHLHRPILRMGLLLAPVFMFLISRAQDYFLLIPLSAAYALFAAPIVPILDSSAVAVARRGSVTYGQMRVGGTIGWIVSVWLVGMLTQAFGLHWLFYAYVTFMGGTFLYALSGAPAGGSTQIELLSNLRLLLANRSVVFFLLSVFLVALANNGVQAFFSLYLDGIGAGEGIIGAAWALAAVSELPVMLFSGSLIRRMGPAAVLKLAFLAYALRWLLFSFIHDPLWALAVQLLHGLSFAGFLTAGVTYLNERTPEGLGATAQAIFTVVAFGVAAIIGSLAGGYLYDHSGMVVFFQIFSGVTVAGLIVFWVTSAGPWRRMPYGANA